MTPNSRSPNPSPTFFNTLPGVGRPFDNVRRDKLLDIRTVVSHDASGLGEVNARIPALRASLAAVMAMTTAAA